MCMSIEDLETVERLGRLIGRLTSNSTLREDLMQEALVHLWQIQQQQPGQTESWYLQNCRFHLQHYLSSGRSVDSLKRSGGRIHPSENGDDHDSLLDIFDNEETCEAVLADVIARDIITCMSKWLPHLEQIVLQHLAEGLGTCDIAKRLNISHPMVIKHRRKIAAMATKLAISSLPEYQKKTFPRLKKRNDDSNFPGTDKVSRINSLNGVNRVGSAARANGKDRANGKKPSPHFVGSESSLSSFCSDDASCFALCEAV